MHITIIIMHITLLKIKFFYITSLVIMVLRRLCLRWLGRNTYSRKLHIQTPGLQRCVCPPFHTNIVSTGASLFKAHLFFFFFSIQISGGRKAGNPAG